MNQNLTQHETKQSKTAGDDEVPLALLCGTCSVAYQE